MRAGRTGCAHDEVYLAAESDVQTVLGHIEAVDPGLVIIDSVQTMTAGDADGVAGGVTQVRAVTAALTAVAKCSAVAMVLVGHVTKDGAIAGATFLEHLVDVVLHFEGDRNTALRMVRGSRTASAPPMRWAVSCCRTTASRVSPIPRACSWTSARSRFPVPLSRSHSTASAH